MKKLWQKNWELDSFIESFETKDDLILDQKLIAYDVYGSIAHAKMLSKIGLLSATELKKLMNGLLTILDLAEKNKFSLEDGDEDMHSKIENFLVEKYGGVGKKIHTGRSRNDQVLAAVRLYNKEKLLYIWKELIALIESFCLYAKKHEFIPMPGYTHTQKAMPSSVGMWGGAFAESLLDDLVGLKTAYILNNRSPLGAAAGYGVPLPLDREYTSKQLGFKRVQINSLYTQNSRGKIEAAILASLNSILLTINKFATDVVLFTSYEFGYFKVAKKLCTGSSIMPQKKNVDIAELLRSKVHVTLGNYSQLVGLSTNLPSGYNRDLQDSKKPLMESLEITQGSIKIANIIVNSLTPKTEKMQSSLTPEIFATHKSLELVSQGVPFRKAYQEIGANISSLNAKNYEDYLMKSTHLGGTGNLGLTIYLAQLKEEKQEYKDEFSSFKQSIKNLQKI